MSDDNGSKTRLAVVEARIKELEPQKENPDVRKALTELYNEKIKLTVSQSQSKDYKIAEIWVRDGQIMLDASPDFWDDKLRARGLLLFCDDIVVNYQPPKQKTAPGQGGIIQYVKNLPKNLKKRF